MHNNRPHTRCTFYGAFHWDRILQAELLHESADLGATVVRELSHYVSAVDGRLKPSLLAWLARRKTYGPIRISSAGAATNAFGRVRS